MRRIGRGAGAFAAAVLVGALASCQTQPQAPYDPLADYEQVEPATIQEAPVAQARADNRDQVEHGAYLVELLGCGSCHTDGALVGRPDRSLRLAGSTIGIAYTSPLEHPDPGIVYPPNLTPDVETGLGSWRWDEIALAIRHGEGRFGRSQQGVMPWRAYAKLSVTDLDAIIAYLQSLPPVEHRVPANVLQGNPAVAPYVHFGVYRSRERR